MVSHNDAWKVATNAQKAVSDDDAQKVATDDDARKVVSDNDKGKVAPNTGYYNLNHIFQGNAL